MEIDLEDLVFELDALMAKVAKAGLQENVALLKIARLHLALRAYGLSETELDLILASADTSTPTITPTTLGRC
jgi:hypothetical protein